MSVIDELRMNSMLEMNTMLKFSQPVKEENSEETVDRSDEIFSYMNMIAYNNKRDLKLN